jgi:aspartate aminotransferase-like enzyme
MKRRLYTPGPTPVPEEIMLKMAEPISHHRLPSFEVMFSEANQNLQYLFNTKQLVITLTSSGSGAMEAAVTNILSQGDKVIAVRGGKFGERWAEICQAYGIEVIPIDIEWGDSVSPESIEELLKKEKNVKAVFTTQSETSTGALNDIKTIAEMIKPYDTLLVVDSITGIGVHEMKPDDWGVDVVVTGSQKGLMLPPGLAFICLSARALAAMEKSTLPKYYFSLKKALKAMDKKQTPWTPALTLIIGLNEALKMIKNEGLEQLYARHQRLADATRAGVKALDLALLAKHPSNVLTAIRMPDSINTGALVKYLRDELGILVAGGQGHLKGKIIRIAHLGYVDDFDIIVVISALERGLKKMGYSFKIGSGVEAAQNILCQ